MTHGAGNINLVDEDLSFVARMLGDAADLGPAVAAGTSARMAAHKRDRAAWASSQKAKPSDHDQALLARHNKPTSRSNSKLYHCEACDCSVGPHERDWAVHTLGIKHKRQLVSLLHTGQLGNNVVSLFEAEPVISQQQQPATWMKQFRIDYSCDMPKLKKARTEVMKGLLNLGGNSTYTQRIAGHYEETAFCHTWAAAAQKLADQAAQTERLHLSLSADELVCVSQLLPVHRHIKQLTVSGLSHTGAAQAGSADQHQAWKCMEDAIAISMLLATCRSLHGLETLIIKFQHVGTLHQTVRHHTPRKDPFQDISRMYSQVWVHLQELLRNSLSLSEVKIALSCQYPWNVNMFMLKEAAHHGHRDRTAVITQSVLMGTHKRGGLHSCIWHLPPPVLREILTAALPKEPCQVWVSSAADSWVQA
ncbi:hypothetical protein WJX79_009069 [Trebouxia sp. C0005]